MRDGPNAPYPGLQIKPADRPHETYMGVVEAILKSGRFRAEELKLVMGDLDPRNKAKRSLDETAEMGVCMSTTYESFHPRNHAEYRRKLRQMVLCLA